MNLDNFNLATADKHQMKYYAKEKGLSLSLSMTDTTMRQKIQDYCVKNDIEAPVASVGTVPKDVKRVTINIAKQPTPDGAEPVFVGVQGVGYTIPRGINVQVPPAVVEVLKNAVQDIITQDEEGEIHHQEVLTYPYNEVAA